MIDIFLSLVLIMISCLVIWKTGDSFDLASEYLGRKMTAGVKGATINAIGSSIPELFTVLLFLLLSRDEQGFAGGIGTSAGSAIFNAIIIPAVVILSVSFTLKNRVIVSKKVILRDGIFLLIAELFLIYLLGKKVLTAADGLSLMAFYLLYLIVLFLSMKRGITSQSNKQTLLTKTDSLSDSSRLDLKKSFAQQNPLNFFSAWLLLLVSIIVISAACFLLVHSCELLGKATGTSLYFVSIILASAATSVPDMILSLKDANNGNYNDALSNAFGSNIFDICFAIGFPLVLFSFFFNKDITLSQQVIREITPLQVLLLFFTFIATIIFLTGRFLGKRKAYLLLFMYIVFVALIIAQSLDIEGLKPVIEWLDSIGLFIQNIHF